MTPSDSTSHVFPRTSAIIVISLVLFVIAAPRLILAGGLPTTDEGFYAYYAQIMHAGLAQGAGVPDAGPMMLYPFYGELGIFFQR